MHCRRCFQIPVRLLSVFKENWNDFPKMAFEYSLSIMSLKASVVVVVVVVCVSFYRHNLHL